MAAPHAGVFTSTVGTSARTVLRSHPLGDLAESPLPADFQFPAAKELPQLEYELVELANGLKVYLVEQHDAPLIRGSITWPGGLYASPADKVRLFLACSSLVPRVFLWVAAGHT